MTSKHIVVLDSDTLPEEPVLNFAFEHTLTAYGHTDAGDVTQRLAGADVAITNKVRIDAAAIAANPQLKLIAVAATGYEHVDIAAAAENGTAVCNIRAYGNDAVAEHAFMLILALMRQLPAYQRDVAAGLWQKSPFFCHFGAPIHDVNGKTLGIFGRGGIGKALAVRAEAFGMKVLWGEHKNAAGCREGYTPFGDVLAQSDVVSLHCPLNEETRNMLGEKELQAMKPGAMLINVGRGGLADEMSVVAALKYGTLGGAGFDVLTEEPPVNGNPLLSARLPNLIVTPHMAWGSSEALARLMGILQDNINGFFAGNPHNILTACR